MVIERTNNFDFPLRNEIQPSNSLTFVQCLFRSMTLNPINIEEINPSILLIFLFGFLLSLKLFILVSVIRLAFRVKIGSFIFLPVFFIIIMAYIFTSAYIYRLFVPYRTRRACSKFAYITSFSITYLPLGFFISLLMGDIYYLVLVGVVIVSQYYISSCIGTFHYFGNNKEILAFTVATFVIQNTFVLGLFYVVELS